MPLTSNLRILESGRETDDAEAIDTEILDDAEAIDTEILDDAVDDVLHDTEVVHYADSVENSDGYDTEVVPDSDDEMMDTNDSKGHSSRGLSFIKRLAANLYKVDSPCHPICKKLDQSHDIDACGDEGHNTLSLETDMIVRQGNEVSPSTVHTDLQATKPDLQDGNTPTSCNVNLTVDVKEISVENKVEKNDSLSQLKKREVHVVYTRKRNRLCKPNNNEAKDMKTLKRSTDDCNDYTRLSYVDSQEPEDLSTALCFVDQYISVNAMPTLSSPIATVKTKQNSPPVLSSKGAQSLVKMKQNKVGIFEWDDNLDGIEKCIPSEKKGRPRSDFVGKKCNQTYVRRSPSVKNHVVTGQVCKKDAREESTLTNTEINVIPEESECFFDVGMDTQIAAEAIQALSFSISADCSAMEADKVPQKLSEKLGEAAENEMHKGIWSFPKKTRSAYRDISDPKNLFQAQIMEASKQVARSSGKVAAKCVAGRSSEKSGKVKLTKKAKAYRDKEAHVCKENLNGSLSVEDMAPCKRKNRRKVKNIHPDSANLNSSSLFNIREGLVSKYTSKRVADRNTIVSLECNLLGSTDWCLRDYPRGKRVCRPLQDRSEGHSDLGDSSVKVSQEKHKHYSLRCQLNKESCSGSSVPFSSFKRKRRSTIYISPCLSSSIKYERNFPRHPVCELKENDYLKMKNTSSGQLTESTITVQASPLNVTGFKANENMNSDDATFPSCQASPSETNSTNLVDGRQEQHDKKKPSTPALTRELHRLGFRESLPDFSPKSSRRKKTMANIRVLLSQNLNESTRKHQMKILMRFGVPIASSPTEATHFVTDRFARTRNMLEFIAQGKPVVTHQWLESCDQAGCYIDDGDYIVRDVKKEHQHGFRLPISLDRARHHPLLTGYKVFITPNTKPGKEILASLVKAVHGEVINKVMDSKLDNLLILSCDEDQADCIPFLQRGTAAYTSELLLNGIIIQKLEFARHRLFISQVKGK